MSHELSHIVVLLASAAQEPRVVQAEIARYCEQQSRTPAEVYEALARRVAIEFARGEMSYATGDAAMNTLASAANFEIDGFAWQVFSLFDSGEFQRSGDLADSVPWQTYTLPGVMSLLKEHGIAIWP